MLNPNISTKPVRLTIVYEDAGDGWVMACIPEIPGVITQGANVEHAREMIHSALRDWLEHHVQDQHGHVPATPVGSRSESLHIVVGA
jgi:predicted RNase H-like HicB family nuclease